MFWFPLPKSFTIKTEQFKEILKYLYILQLYDESSNGMLCHLSLFVLAST